MEYRFKEREEEPVLENHLNLGGVNPNGERIVVTSRYFKRADKPWIGVMGEYHYSRDRSENWRYELLKMKAGGITVVSTYVFWIYHEETEGVFDFSGDNDLRGFVSVCADIGLDVVIRIGPWAHGECRNGGFPDWLIKKGFALRENNPEYLEKVRIFYKEIFEQTKGMYYADGGNIIAVQLENELVDNAGHLAKLKEIAIESGIIAPIYTVTGWNSSAGAKIPVDEVVPVFGGYCEAPWEQHMRRLAPSPHYFFVGMRNDSAIGADLIAHSSTEGWQLPYERYPYATCELGGGIQITHHRRPIIRGMDIYAVSLVKLGEGNNFVGYYMYHGGTNKLGRYSTLNETRDTGYPNDYPILSYDFQAALSQYGEVREHYGLLNMLHLFVQDFGGILAPMVTAKAENEPARDDVSMLRYAMRTDGHSGFVFINHYQRLGRLKDVRGAVIDTGAVKFPPIDICGDVSFILPFNICGLEYATAQLLCREGNALFFAEIPGINAEYKIDTKVYRACGGEVVRAGNLQIVTLGFEQAKCLRRLNNKLYIGHGCNLYADSGRILSAEGGFFEYSEFCAGDFVRRKGGNAVTAAQIQLTKVEKPPFMPEYADRMNFKDEPKRRIDWFRAEVSDKYGFVEIDYFGDGAQLYADGRLIADDFYYGKPWRIPAGMLYNHECYVAVSELREDFYREF